MKFNVHLPFAELLGLELVRFENGEADIAVEQREALTNAWDVIHGGVTMTLLDVAMAHAARSPTAHLPDGGPGVVTIEMKTSFMRPGTGRLLAKGRLLTRTASLAFCEGSVFSHESDGAGKLVAHATGTFKYLAGLPVGGRIVQRRQASD